MTVQESEPLRWRLRSWRALPRDTAIQANDACTAKFVGLSELAAMTTEWSDLLDNSIEPNIFYSPPFAIHLLKNIAAPFRGGAIVIRDRERLIGLWPVKLAPMYWVEALHTAFSASSVPLLRIGSEADAARAIFRWLGQRRGMGRILLATEFELDGKTADLFQTIFAECGTYAPFDEFARPVIDTCVAPDAESYIAQLKGRNRQMLRRKWRRLSKNGKLAYTAHAGADLGPAMEEFLQLEKTGWKGKSGTAMAMSRQTRALARDVLCSPEFGGTRIEFLRLDGKPVAASIHVGCGETAYHFKPAYDESLKEYSPGLLLHLKSIEGLYGDRWAMTLDSAVRPGDRLGSIWRQQRRIGRLLLSPSRPASLALLAIRHGIGIGIWGRRLIKRIV